MFGDAQTALNGSRRLGLNGQRGGATAAARSFAEVLTGSRRVVHAAPMVVPSVIRAYKRRNHRM